MSLADAELTVALGLARSLRETADRLIAVLQPQMEEANPADPRNKGADGKFTPRGVEICYRLFDQGKTRYAVADAMGISFSAATHRYDAWQRAGGADRRRVALD